LKLIVIVRIYHIFTYI